MITKVKFIDAADRAVKIAENSDKRLVAEHNHLDGNWLFFDDSLFDLSTRELKAILTGIIKVINVRLSTAGLPVITAQEAKAAIKTELDKL